MYSGQTALLNCPDWYRVEKDTGNTIKKLSTVKELSFYLKNPDEYVRRLAILRINELKLKDSIDVLKEVLDDHLESLSNKELAAWTIKAVSLKWNIDIFISNKFISKYTGSEKFSDIFRISVNDFMPSISFDFSTEMINAELQSDSSDIRSSEDIVFNTSFNFKEWFSIWLSSFLNDFKKVVITLPGKFIKVFISILTFILKRVILDIPVKSYKLIRGMSSAIQINKKKKLSRIIIGAEAAGEAAVDTSAGAVNENVACGTLDSLRPKYYSYMKENTFRISFLEILKKAFFGILHFIFSPVRLFGRHRFFSAACVILIYLFLTYTTAGKILTYKNFGLDLMDMQNNTVESVEEILSFALAEVQSLAGIQPEKSGAGIDNKKNAAKPPLKKYRVTAKTGLNLRKAPLESAPKADSNLLPNNSVVSFLSNTQKDSSGKVWFLVQTESGTSGWAYSKWLEEIGGVDNAGR